MEDKIIEIIEELAEIENLKENKEMDLIENDVLDSLAFIELIYRLEEEFNIEIEPTQVKSDTWRRVSKIEKLVINLKSK